MSCPNGCTHDVLNPACVFVHSFNQRRPQESTKISSTLERAADDLKIAQEQLSYWDLTHMMTGKARGEASQKVADAREALDAAVAAR